MSDLQARLTEIQERVERATPGPWDYNLSGIWAEVWRADEDTSWISLTDDPSLPVTSITGPHKYAPPAENWHDNAGFIAHSRSDIPFLLQALTEALGALEYSRDRTAALLAAGVLTPFLEPRVQMIHDSARQAITRISEMGVEP